MLMEGNFIFLWNEGAQNIFFTFWIQNYWCLKVGSCGEQIKQNWTRERKENKVNHRWGRFYAYVEGNFMSWWIKELTKELLLPGCLEGRCLSRKTDGKVIKNHRRASPLTAPKLAKSNTGVPQLIIIWIFCGYTIYIRQMA